MMGEVAALTGGSDGDGVGTLGPRSVTGLGVIGQGLAIGPTFSAGFVSGGIAVYAGFNTPLSVAIAAIGVIALAYVLSLYGRRFAGPGVAYEYLAHGVNRSAGIVGAGIYAIGMLFLGAGGAFVAEGYLTDRLLASEFSIRLGWPVWALAALAVAVAINHLGVRIGLRAIVVTAALSLIPFLVVAIAIIADGGASGNSLVVFDPRQTSWTAIFHGVLFAILMFVGFETVAALGEEARRPRRSIPLMMIATIVLCGAFYLLIAYAGAIGFGRAAAAGAWFDSGNPFGDLGQRYVGHALGPIINLTIVLDLFSVCVALTLATSRVLLALARDRLLPGVLGRTSPRFHTPTGGLAVIAAWALLAIGWAASTHYGAAGHRPDVLEALLILTSAGTCLVAVVYLMLALGGLLAIGAPGGRAVRWWRLPCVLAAAAVPLLALDGALDPWPAYPADLGPLFAAAAVVIVIVWWAMLRTWRPELVSRAAANAATTVPAPAQVPQALDAAVAIAQADPPR
jgi:amino acid transporter